MHRYAPMLRSSKFSDVHSSGTRETSGTRITSLLNAVLKRAGLKPSSARAWTPSFWTLSPYKVTAWGSLLSSSGPRWRAGKTDA
jgi:hypothetical protein